MIYIYSRVSTVGQNSDQQADLLKEQYEYDKVVIEKASGKDMERPKFLRLIKKLKADDTLIVYSVCRLGRKASEVLTVVEELKTNGVRLIIHKLGDVDICSSMGQMILTIFSGVAEMERSVMLERQRIGIERAKAEGKYSGRKPTDKSIVETARLLKANGMKMPAIAKRLNVGQSTLYKLIKN